MCILWRYDTINYLFKHKKLLPFKNKINLVGFLKGPLCLKQYVIHYDTQYIPHNLIFSCLVYFQYYSKDGAVFSHTLSLPAVSRAMSLALANRLRDIQIWAKSEKLAHICDGDVGSYLGGRGTKLKQQCVKSFLDAQVLCEWQGSA